MFFLINRSIYKDHCIIIEKNTLIYKMRVLIVCCSIICFFIKTKVLNYKGYPAGHIPLDRSNSKIASIIGLLLKERDGSSIFSISNLSKAFRNSRTKTPMRAGA